MMGYKRLACASKWDLLCITNLFQASCGISLHRDHIFTQLFPLPTQLPSFPSPEITLSVNYLCQSPQALLLGNQT